MAEETTKQATAEEPKAVLEYYGPEATIHGVGSFVRGQELTRDELAALAGGAAGVPLLAADLTTRKWFRFTKTKAGIELAREAKSAAEKKAAEDAEKKAAAKA